MKKYVALALLLGLITMWACSGPGASTGDSASKASSRHVIYRSMDQGLTWTPIKNDLPEDVQVSFMEPLGDDIVVATDNRGVFVSQDGLKAWQSIGKGLPGAKINALHTQGKDIWVSVYAQGIFYRAAESDTWQNLSFDLPQLRVQSIYKGESLLAGTDDGIFELDPSNRTWSPLLKGPQILSIELLGEDLVAGTSQGSYLSKDQGQTWQPIHNLGAVHCTHVVGDQIAEFYLNGDLYLSADGGANFSEIYYRPREWSYVYEMVKAGDALIMSNNFGVHQSLDGGQNWQLVYPEEAVGFFDFLVKGDIVYGGTRIWDEYRGR